LLAAFSLLVLPCYYLLLAAALFSLISDYAAAARCHAAACRHAIIFDATPRHAAAFTPLSGVRAVMAARGMVR